MGRGAERSTAGLVAIYKREWGVGRGWGEQCHKCGNGLQAVVLVETILLLMLALKCTGMGESAFGSVMQDPHLSHYTLLACTLVSLAGTCTSLDAIALLQQLCNCPDKVD